MELPGAPRACGASLWLGRLRPALGSDFADSRDMLLTLLYPRTVTAKELLEEPDDFPVYSFPEDDSSPEEREEESIEAADQAAEVLPKPLPCPYSKHVSGPTINFKKKGMTDERLEDFCIWFYSLPDKAESYTELDFSENELTSQGVALLLSTKGSLKELHLSHNRLSTAEGLRIVLAAVKATDSSGMPSYPHSGKKIPLWLRLENNLIDNKSLRQQLQSELALEQKTLDKAVCFVNGSGPCRSGYCSKRNQVAQVHLTYLCRTSLPSVASSPQAGPMALGAGPPAPRGPPQLPAPVRGALVAKEGELTGNYFKYICIFYVGLEEDSDFNIVKCLLGRGGANVKEIVDHCNAKLRLLGVGSHEANLPLQLHLCCTKFEEYQEAAGRVARLLRAVYRIYRRFLHKKGFELPDIEVQVREVRRDDHGVNLLHKMGHQAANTGPFPKIWHPVGPLAAGASSRFWSPTPVNRRSPLQSPGKAGWNLPGGVPTPPQRRSPSTPVTARQSPVKAAARNASAAAKARPREHGKGLALRSTPEQRPMDSDSDEAPLRNAARPQGKGGQVGKSKQGSGKGQASQRQERSRTGGGKGTKGSLTKRSPSLQEKTKRTEGKGSLQVLPLPTGALQRSQSVAKGAPTDKGGKGKPLASPRDNSATSSSSSLHLITGKGKGKGKSKGKGFKGSPLQDDLDSDTDSNASGSSVEGQGLFKESGKGISEGKKGSPSSSGSDDLEAGEQGGTSQQVGRVKGDGKLSKSEWRRMEGLTVRPVSLLQAPPPPPSGPPPPNASLISEALGEEAISSAASNLESEVST